MVKKPGAKMDQSQRDKIIDKARELGCDENEAAFEDKLRRIMPKPKKDEAPQE